jgi:pimeloyl-ACP methyl ester carboxylesterase
VTPPVAPTSDTVESSDGVAVAVHHLGAGPESNPLQIAHATGFHARAYTPLAEALTRTHDVWGHDVRGHGSTALPPDWIVDWHGYGDDATAVARWLAARAAGVPLVGVGHSLGGALLLMAADRFPDLFEALVLYEPIVFPPTPEPFDPGQSPLAQGALRRRREFASYREAIGNYRSKPPMNAFDPAAVEHYVFGGFRPVDPADPTGPVELTCTPEHESATFAASHNAGLWERLPDIATPTVVIGGRDEPSNPPARMAEPIADQLGAGRYLPVALDHFGPFTHPGAVASIIESATS